MSTSAGKFPVVRQLASAFKKGPAVTQDVVVVTEYHPKDEGRPSQHSSEGSEGRSSQDELLLAAGIDQGADDPSLPCLTLRMWTISIVLTVVVSALNTLYTLRKPSITLNSAVVQLIAFPIGRAWEKLLPDWTLSAFGRKLQLNPGPFNEKVQHKIKASAPCTANNTCSRNTS